MKQSAWMWHWMQPKCKQTRDGTFCLENKDMRETKQHSLPCNKGTEPSGSKAVTATIEGDTSQSVEVTSNIGTDGSRLKNERSDLLSFPIFDMNKKGGTVHKQVPGTQAGQSSDFFAATTPPIKPHSACAFGRQLQEIGISTLGCKLLPKEIAPNFELELRARDSVDGGCNCMPAAKPSLGKLPRVPCGYNYGVMYRNEKVIPFKSTSKEHLTHHSSYHDFDIDTMRISNTLDARASIHTGTPMYAETTRHFFITEKTAIGVSDEVKILRESMLSTKFNGNLGDFLSLSPTPGQVRSGLKLQLLDGSTDTEQKCRGTEENEKDGCSQSIGKLNKVGFLMDETSAETGMMEVDALLENNQICGMGVYGSNKAALRGQSTASSQGKFGNVVLPGMNEVAHSPDGSANHEQPSTSRTQSLDTECLFSNNDCPCYSKSNPGRVSNPQSDLGSRWVKRLKQSSSNTTYAVLGTKGSKIEESSSYEKRRKLFNNLFHCNVSQTHSEPILDTRLMNTSVGKMTAENPILPNVWKDSSTDSLKDRNALLSHSWIQRWCHDQSSSSKKQSIPTEPSELQKADFDHFQKKSFPSIAAMALMGKTMNGFHPCEFTKKGSFIVWNTNNHPND